MTTTLTPSRGIDVGAPIRVLIAEDEAHLGAILEQFMTARGFAVTIVRNGRDALESLQREQYDVALLDVVMPEVDGLEVLRQTREGPLPPEIIVITGNGTMETALAALKLGAYDFLSKPYRMAEIEALVRRAWEKRILARDNVLLQSRLRRVAPETRFVTQFAPLLAVLSLVERVAPSMSPVLVTGEPGSGKGLLARLVHERSGTPEAAFVDVACGTPAPSLARELFGVEQGMGPGFEERRVGLLELASGGTLFLDDVDRLDPAVQEQLLDALTTGRFRRVGGVQQLHLRARVVASTSADLSAAVDAGRFLEPLLHRISATRIVLPALRERVVDVPLLARHFLQRFDERAPLALSADAVSTLERYRWPGNVRELRNVMERAALLATDGVIGARELPLGAASSASAAPVADERYTARDIPTLSELERRHIADVLERTNWHQGRAADMLGISPKTLYRKIREYGFRRPPVRSV